MNDKIIYALEDADFWILYGVCTMTKHIRTLQNLLTEVIECLRPECMHEACDEGIVIAV